MQRIVKPIEYDYLKMQKIIDALCCRNECLQQFCIGKSCAGRDITAVKIGQSDEYVLLAAAFHGHIHAKHHAQAKCQRQQSLYGTVFHKFTSISIFFCLF